MRVLLQFFLIILFLGLTAAFAALNDQVISINYFVGESQLSLSYLLLACFIVGGLMILLLLSGSYLRLHLELRRLRNSASMNNQELANLRKLPVKEPY